MGGACFISALVSLLLSELVSDNAWARTPLVHGERPPTTVLKAEYKPMNLAPPSFDALHYKVWISFPAVSQTQPMFEGRVELTLRPSGSGLQMLVLDSAALEIHRVELLSTAQELRFVQHEQRLEIDLNRVYKPEETLTVAVDYAWSGKFDTGMYLRSRVGVSFTETVYSQSEPEESKYWFPGYARPNDRATFEAFLRVPKPLLAISNGELLEVRADKGYRVFHWREKFEMPSYLFSVAAGHFGIHRESWNGIPLEYYGPRDDMKRVAYSLRNTPDILTYFSKITGHAYSFEKYSQVVVPRYPWGGMEHMTASTLEDSTVHSEAEDAEFSSDGLVAHEIAHQWFGDLVTSKNWDHLWLNEGFATYFDGLNQERVNGRDALLQFMAEGAEWYFQEDQHEPRPVVFPFYKMDLDETFDSHSYAKGAWVLHMLRAHLGDEVFFRSIQTYLKRFQGQLVTTDDFVSVVEEVSGEELDWFFNQWLYRPGHPQFDSEWSYDEAEHEVVLKIEQTQAVTAPGGIVGTVPVFTGTLPVEIDGTQLDVKLSEAKHVFRLSAPAKPRYVKINSENTWLARVKMKQAVPAWVAQLSESEDITARIEAAQALGEVGQGEISSARDVLLSCAQKDPETWVRKECIESLQVLAEKATSEKKAELPAEMVRAVRALADDPSWEVRKAALKVLWRVSSAPEVMGIYREKALSDPSISVAATALEEIGSFDQPGTFEFLVGQLERVSFQDRAREAALKGLARLQESKAWQHALRFVSHLYADNVRVAAMDVLVTFARKFDGAVAQETRRTLEGALKDLSYTVKKAAIAGLVALKDKEAIPALKSAAERDSDYRIRGLALDAIEELGK